MSRSQRISTGPLNPLPLSMFVPSMNTLPSPVSMPLKRGLSPGSDDAKTQQSQRRKPIKHASNHSEMFSIDAEGLESGQSPARLLFVDSHTTSVPRLAPSPPMSISYFPPTPDMRSAENTNGAERDLHDIGFAIFYDVNTISRPSTLSHKATHRRSPPGLMESTKENVPPPLIPMSNLKNSRSEAPGTPGTPRRNKALERSRLGLESVSADSSDFSDVYTPVRLTVAQSKDALKREVDSV